MKLTQLHHLIPKPLLWWCQQDPFVPITFTILKKTQLPMGEFLANFQVTIPNRPLYSIHIFFVTILKLKPEYIDSFLHLLSPIIYLCHNLIRHWKFYKPTPLDNSSCIDTEKVWLPCRLKIVSSVMTSCVLDIMDFDRYGSSFTLKYVSKFTR